MTIFDDDEVDKRMQKILGGAFSGPPTPLKGIPARSEQREIRDDGRLTPDFVSLNPGYACHDANARSTAAMAWIVVVSNSGTALSSWETRSMISVQPRMMASAPWAIRPATILR